jgi:hypothetical protein
MSNPITNHRLIRQLALAAGNERKLRIEALAGPGTTQPFTRVSEAFYDCIDAEVRNLVERRAREHWQKGMTLT